MVNEPLLLRAQIEGSLLQALLRGVGLLIRDLHSGLGFRVDSGFPDIWSQLSTAALNS